jgi:hypothetical protein
MKMHDVSSSYHGMEQCNIALRAHHFLIVFNALTITPIFHTFALQEDKFYLKHYFIRTLALVKIKWTETRVVTRESSYLSKHIVTMFLHAEHCI